VLARPFAYLQLGSTAEARLGWRHGAACAGSAFCVLEARLGRLGSARLAAWRSLCWLGLLRTCGSARPLRLGSAGGTAQPVLARPFAYLQLGSTAEARLGWRHGAACAGSAVRPLAILRCVLRAEGSEDATAGCASQSLIRSWLVAACLLQCKAATADCALRPDLRTLCNNAPTAAQRLWC
jgi:hypothetical protein